MKLHALVGTESEFDHAEKGDALYAFELALRACAPMFTGLMASVKAHACECQGHARWRCMALEHLLVSLI